MLLPKRCEKEIPLFSGYMQSKARAGAEFLNPKLVNNRDPRGCACYDAQTHVTSVIECLVLLAG